MPSEGDLWFTGHRVPECGKGVLTPRKYMFAVRREGRGRNGPCLTLEPMDLATCSSAPENGGTISTGGETVFSVWRKAGRGDWFCMPLKRKHLPARFCV